MITLLFVLLVRRKHQQRRKVLLTNDHTAVRVVGEKKTPTTA